MKNDKASNKKAHPYNADKGERVWHASRLEGVVRNRDTGIKPTKKKGKSCK